MDFRAISKNIIYSIAIIFSPNLSTDCNRTYSDPNGVVESPGFGGYAPSGTQCRFAITTVPSKKISVHFSSFRLGNLWTRTTSANDLMATNCTHSYLKVSP